MLSFLGSIFVFAAAPPAGPWVPSAVLRPPQQEVSESGSLEARLSELEASLEGGDKRAALAGLEQLLGDGLSRLLAPYDDDGAEALLARMTRVASRTDSIRWVAALHQERYERLLSRYGPEDPRTLERHWFLAEAWVQLGRAEESLPVFERVRSAYERRPPEDPRRAAQFAIAHADCLRALDRLDEARRGFEEAIERAREAAGPESTTVLRAMRGLVAVYLTSGDVAGGRALAGELVALSERALGEDHPETLNAAFNLAAAHYDLGEMEAALAVWERVLADWSQRLPRHHPNLLALLANLMLAARDGGELERARRYAEDWLERLRELHGPDHEQVLRAETELAGLLRTMLEQRAALPLYEHVYAVRSRSMPAFHGLRQDAALAVAVTLIELDLIERAAPLIEEVHAARSFVLPPDDPRVLGPRGDLVGIRYRRGDIAGALALGEEVLAARERIHPPDDPKLADTKFNVAAVRLAFGDVDGALELAEQVYRTRQRLYPPEHPDLLGAKEMLAGVRLAAGDRDGALLLAREVVASREAALAPDHPEVLTAKKRLAEVLVQTGDPATARELLEEVLEGRRRWLPEGHESILETLADLASASRELGDLARAAEIRERAYAGAERWPDDHPRRIHAAVALGRARLRLDGAEGARSLLPAVLAGQRARATSLISEPPRVARAAAAAELERFEEVLSIADATRPEEGEPLVAELFETLSALRRVSTASSELARQVGADPELAALREELAELRARINDLAVAGPEEPAGEQAWSRALFDLASARDRLERELRASLGGSSGSASVLDHLHRALAPDEALVSFFRAGIAQPSEGEGGASVEDVLLAFVVEPSGRASRLDLGRASALEDSLHSWRRALGHPLEGRGLPLQDEASPGPEARAAGERLRAGVLDPVLARLSSARRLRVVADDLLHLVPLDALPLEEGVVGDRIAITQLASAFDLEGPGEPNESGAPGELVLVGAVDYDKRRSGGAGTPSALPAPPIGSRAGALALGFSPLSGTAAEVRTIAAMYQERFEAEPEVLDGAGATKDALREAVPGAAFVHVATHGWFASEAADAPAEGERAAGGRSAGVSRNFAPETLCGLALAGANRGIDPLGRVPGILTAEELSTLDLTSCELAVLSACETNVGLRSAGQGIQSLQSALHAAGARTAITSLWRVDDAATRLLFERFYASLWQEGVGKAEALWRARCSLREEGHPTRDWAGWVLTGAPD